MHPSETATFFFTAAVAISLFGIVTCLTQDRNKKTFRALAACLAVSSFGDLGGALDFVVEQPKLRQAIAPIWMVGATSVTPLFWLYVCRITRGESWRPSRVSNHLVLPLLAVALYLASLLGALGWPQPPFGTANRSMTASAQFLGRPWEAVFLIFLAQWVFYLVLTTRQIWSYRKALPRYFASTEDKELRWIMVVISLYSFFVAQRIVAIIYDAVHWQNSAQMPVAIEAFLNALLVGTIAMWGLRQRPIFTEEKPPVTKTLTPYARSALTPEHRARIAQKLASAMVRDRQFLDPNLSLWGLAKHVSTSENYVTEVLNQEIGQSYFDFVNQYRVNEAKRLLCETDQTILDIAYSVGFNSRSSFYTAFQKYVGQTPTAFRKADAK